MTCTCNIPTSRQDVADAHRAFGMERHPPLYFQHLVFGGLQSLDGLIQGGLLGHRKLELRVVVRHNAIVISITATLQKRRGITLAFHKRML